MSLLRASFRNAAIVRTGRHFSRTTLLCEDAKLTKTVADPPPPANSFDALKLGKLCLANSWSTREFPMLFFLGRVHAPTRMEKTFLVWSGRYKSVAEVPDTVP
jgi:Protein of unknown function (DUF1075)